MRIASLYSGGKDSNYALWWALKQGHTPILITMEPEEYSMMFHHPNVKWTKMQAEAMGFEQVIVRTTHKNELADLEKALAEAKKTHKIEGLVTGAVESKYQKDRIEAIANRLQLKAFSPMWQGGENGKDRLLSELTANFEIYVMAVAAEGMGREYLGQPYQKVLAAIKAGKLKHIHPFLEGGEGETFVTDGPIFKKRIEVKEWKIHWDGVRGVAEIVDAKLVAKK
jgi:ABC transporter with metal-binding/Fe-S-binding domain ATP-binding protein